MDKNKLKSIIILFLLSRLLLFIFFIIDGNIHILEYYDSGLYTQIAQEGYNYTSLYAFFPLYPLSIRLLHIIIPSYKICGFLISNICSFLTIILISKLIKKEYKLSLMCLIFTPILAFLTINYTEGLFIFLTTLGYYLYKKDKYLLSAIVVGLSMLTRNSGIILWGAIGLDMLIRLFTKRDITFKKIVMFGLISLSIGMIYPLYLYIREGDPLIFMSMQSTYWHRTPSNFIFSIYKDINVLSKFGFLVIRDFYLFFQTWFIFFLALIIGIKIYKKDTAASLYILVSLFAFQLTDRDTSYWMGLSSVSLFRYVLGLFPIYIYLFDNNDKKYKYFITTVFITLSIINCILLYFGVFVG